MTTGSSFKVTSALFFNFPPSSVLGQQLPAHQDPGRLLLLRLGAARAEPRPRQELRRDGTGHDRRDLVSRRREGYSAFSGMAHFERVKNHLSK